MRTLFALVLALSLVGCVFEPQQPELLPQRSESVMASPSVVGTPIEGAITTAANEFSPTFTQTTGNLVVIVVATAVTVTLDPLNFIELEPGGGATAARFFVFYRQLTGGEGGAELFAPSATTKACWVSYNITGHINPATTPPAKGTLATATSNAPLSPELTPAGGSKDYLFLAAFGQNGEEANDDTWQNNTPTGTGGGSYTPALGYQTTTGITGAATVNCQVCVASRAYTGTVETPTVWSTDQSLAWRAQTIAIYPAVPTGRITAVQGNLTYNRMTGRVTAGQVNLTYNRMTGRVAAAQANITYTTPTGRVAAAQIGLTYDRMTGRVTAAQADTIHSLKTGRVTAAQSDLTYGKKTGRVTAIQTGITYTVPTGRVTATEIGLTYDRVTARVTAGQVDLTYDPRSGRITAGQVDITYDPMTGRITTAQANLTYGLKTVRVTAANGTLIYNPKTGRVTAGSVDLIYDPKTARLTAAQADILYTPTTTDMVARITAANAQIEYDPTLSVKLTAVGTEATSTQKTGRVTGVQSKAYFNPTEPCDPYARVMAAQADVTFARTDEHPWPSPQENPPLYFCTSWHYPTASGQLGNTWVNPTRAYTADGLYAVALGEQDYSGFNFTYDDIPQTATILGIEGYLGCINKPSGIEWGVLAQLTRGVSGAPTLVGDAYESWGDVTFQNIWLPWPQILQGDAGPVFPANAMWNTTWTPAEIINPNFGIDFLSSYTIGDQPRFDFVRMRVWWSVPRGAWVTGLEAHIQATTVDDSQPRVIRSYVIGGGVTATVTSGMVSSGTTKGIVESGVIRSNN